MATPRRLAAVPVFAAVEAVVWGVPVVEESKIANWTLEEPPFTTRIDPPAG